jgi:hypothetical protein
VKNINKYIGKYRIFASLILNTGKTNEDDTYLKGKYHTEISRQDDKNLAIYFPTGVSATNIVLSQFDELGIKYKLHIDAEIEKVYIVSEDDIDKIHKVLKFQTKGSKIKPTSVKTARRQNK